MIGISSRSSRKPLISTKVLVHSVDIDWFDSIRGFNEGLTIGTLWAETVHSLDEVFASLADFCCNDILYPDPPRLGSISLEVLSDAELLPGVEGMTEVLPDAGGLLERLLEVAASQVAGSLVTDLLLAGSLARFVERRLDLCRSLGVSSSVNGRV